MAEHGGRESWSQVPAAPELWASNFGQIATLKHGGGFSILSPRQNQYGEPCIHFKRDGKGHRKTSLVAGLVLAAFGRSRPGGFRIGYRDGDVSNVALDNLHWERKGQAPVGNLTPRKCLGHHCGNATFMSLGKWNQICPICAAVNASRSDADGIHVPGEIPDAPSLAPPTTRKG